MFGSRAEGTKGGASNRKGWPECVTAVVASVRSPGDGTDGDVNVGATGCGGRTME